MVCRAAERKGRRAPRRCPSRAPLANQTTLRAANFGNHPALIPHSLDTSPDGRHWLSLAEVTLCVTIHWRCIVADRHRWVRNMSAIGSRAAASASSRRARRRWLYAWRATPGSDSRIFPSTCSGPMAFHGLRGGGVHSPRGRPASRCGALRERRRADASAAWAQRDRLGDRRAVGRHLAARDRGRL
jgi:hypothetical protein